MPGGMAKMPKELGLDAEPTLQRSEDAGTVRLRATGDWTAIHADALEDLVAAVEKKPARTSVDIDVSAISRLDTFGAWLIERLRRGATQPGVEPQTQRLAGGSRAAGGGHPSGRAR